jgi:hypothetical protein
MKSFCVDLGGGLYRRFYTRFCAWRIWARRWSGRLCAQSHHAVGSIAVADAGFRKPYSGAAATARRRGAHTAALCSRFSSSFSSAI